MKERPILFSAPMVRAILAGQKTQTRRVVKHRADNDCPYHQNGIAVGCHYGKVGDRLWVREEHYAFGRWVLDGQTKRGNPKWRFQQAANIGFQFEAPPAGFRKSRDKEHPSRGCWYQRRARFMPRRASRITLEITDVRVERLLDINRGDATAEGCPYANMAVGPNPREWFAELWDSINGVGAFNANPWVWVVEFRRIQP